MIRFRAGEPAEGDTLEAPPSSMGRRAPRILLYSHDTFGLGHIRRTLSIAWGLASAIPRASLLCLTGSPRAHAFPMPDCMDYLKLPAVTKDAKGQYVSRAANLSFRRVLALRSEVIDAALRTFRPDAVLVDHAPLGMGGELLAALRRLRRERPETRVVLGLRDIIDEGHLIRDAWKREGIHSLIEELYDRVLVYGQQSIFDVAREYALSETTAAKLEYTGYVYHEERETHPQESIRARLGLNGSPLVVLTVGGGEDGHRIVEQYLDGISVRGATSWHSVIVLGPFMKGTLRKGFRELAAKLPGVSLVDFTSRLRGYIAEADAVVAMGGYNTLVETIALGKRAVVLPRIAPRREQLIRAKRFEERGLLRWLDPDRCAPGQILRALDEVLATPPSKTPPLDLRGVSGTVRVLSELLGLREARDPEISSPRVVELDRPHSSARNGFSHDHEEPLVRLVGDESRLPEVGEDLPQRAAVE